MRILHVNKFFDFQGGAEMHLHRLMKAQSHAGHDVHAFATAGEKDLPSPDRPYFVHRMDLDRREGWEKDAEKAMKYVWNVEAKRSMDRLLEQLKPDVVHLHNIYHHLSTSILVPIRRRHVPCVQTLHDYKLACPNYRMFTEGAPCERCKGGAYWNAVAHHCLAPGLAPNVLAAIEMGMTKVRQSYERSVRLFLCPSRFMLEKMQDWGEPPGKLRYVPNPVDLPESASPRGGGYLLYAGRLVVEKGLESFIEAIARVPEVQLKIAGRGPEDHHLRERVQSLHATNVEFLGFQAPEMLNRWRRHAEAVVLPSIWYENASLTLLEAMGEGIPCLASRIGGNPELIDDGVHGFLSRPGDVEEWVKTLRRFLALAPQARTSMGEAARARVSERYTWGRHIESVSQAYSDARSV